MSKPLNIKCTLALSLGFFVLFWVGDALIDLLYFSDGASSLPQSLFHPDARELYMRSVVCSLLALLFLLVSIVSHRSRRAEVALKHSDEITGIFFDSTKHAICIVNTGGLTVSAANRNFLQRFEVREEQALGGSFSKLLAAQGLPEAMVAQVRECAETGGAVTSEMTYRGRDGRKVFEEISTFPVGDPQKGVARVLLVMRDITVRRTSEALLQESESRYRAIFESTGTAMAIVRMDGKLHMVNRGFERITGYSRDELEGKRLWTEFVNPRDVEAMQDHRCAQRCACDDLEQCIELQVIDRFGAARDMVGTWSLIDVAEKAILSLVDISAQKRVEEALRESRATLALAQRIAHLGNLEWDLTTDTITWSEELYRIFDVNPDGFTPTHEWFLQTVHPDDRARVIRAVNDTIYNRRPYDTEYRIVTPAGAVRSVASRGEVTYDAKGTPLRMIGTIQDITWRTEAEQALRHSEEKFSKAFRASPDSIVITRAENGTYIDVNQAFQEITGYTREEVIGKSSTELGLWADPDARMVMLRLMNQYGHVHNLDVKFRVKSGEIRELLWSAEVIEYQGEACLIAISRDVTEQRHLEKELLESDARLYMKHEELKNLFHQMEGIRREWEETMDCIGDMFILADQSGSIRRFNRAVETFSGKAHRDIVGRQWPEFLEEHGLKTHLETPGVELFHEGSGKWLVLKRYAFPAADLEGSGREVIIINDTTGTGLRRVSASCEAVPERKVAH